MVYFTFFGLKEKRAIYAGSRIKIALRVYGLLYDLWRKTIVNACSCCLKRISLYFCFEKEGDDEMETDQTEEGNQPFVAHVPVPSQKEVGFIIAKLTSFSDILKTYCKTFCFVDRHTAHVCAQRRWQFYYFFFSLLLGRGDACPEKENGRRTLINRW